MHCFFAELAFLTLKIRRTYVGSPVESVLRTLEKNRRTGSKESSFSICAIAEFLFHHQQSHHKNSQSVCSNRQP